jgi:hypothetical protein
MAACLSHAQAKDMPKEEKCSVMDEARLDS